MIEQDYNNYHDDTFSLDEAERYSLLIQIDKTSFSYAVADQDKLVAWAENHTLDELGDPQELLDLLSAKYKQVVIGLPAKAFTLVPQSLFHHDHTARFARFLDVKPGEKVCAQVLDSDNTIVYKTNEAILSAAEDLDLRNTVFSSKGWIAAIAKNNPANHELFLDINRDKVEIVGFNAGKLRFYNQFEFQNSDELAYFTTLVVTELNLQPADTNIYLSGSVDDNDENMNRLAEFFGKVAINELRVLQLPQEIESHKLLSLAALALCVSSEAV
ncbi:DUF3822 family protein [Mucilaginibacter sp. SP1R1]|uniref:DUF3822 family protein n=1 Tax=Mucilaginibacter sp. SP1R1 TaxID=2723091 RepID=UPI001612F0DE|nr:DUF3822 family protein [Mucilaginibacter sp. SP1R1]MBB6149711.1 hypothetical protein [Mucilaginibacter sp. SP1R1]